MFERTNEATRFKTGDKRCSTIGRKGGSAKSPAKKRASKLRTIRQMHDAGMDISKHAPFIYKLATDPEFAASDLVSRAIELIDEIKNDPSIDPDLKRKMLQTYNNIYRSIHKQTYNFTQINIGQSQQAEKEIEDFLIENVDNEEKTE